MSIRKPASDARSKDAKGDDPRYPTDSANPVPQSCVLSPNPADAEFDHGPQPPDGEAFAVIDLGQPSPGAAWRWRRKRQRARRKR